MGFGRTFGLQRKNIHNGAKMLDVIEPWNYFTSPIYSFNKPEFLTNANKVCLEQLAIKKKTEKLNEIYPMYNTGSLNSDERLKDLVDYVIQMSWSILDNQGYNMNLYRMEIYEFWCQEHYQGSGHERHVHSSVISGFYFLETPPNSCKLIIHEPRNVKEYANLIEKDQSQATYASNMINFVPQPGTIMFTNSWLPHSFTKNESKKPFRMIHFNLGVNYTPPAVEII